MAVLGIRCSNTDFTYAVLAGTRDIPQVLALKSLALPNGYPRPQALKWVVQEADAIIKKNTIECIVIKRYEGRSKGNDYEARVEAEGAVAIAAADNGIRVVLKKQKSTIAKDLGLKGRARYLTTALDTSPISDFGNLSEKKKDAVLAAWSAL